MEKLNENRPNCGAHSKVFEGLEKALNRNLELQRSTKHSDVVGTDIFVKDERGKNRWLTSVSMGVATQDGKAFFPDADGDGKDHLMVCFAFTPDVVDGDELRLQEFRNLDIYKLFTEKIECNNGVKWYEYVIDFGNNVKDAAQLLSRVIHEIYSIPYETNLDYYTNSGMYSIEKNREIIMG
jgi:hypothetical protein